MPHVDEGQLHAYLDGELLALGVSADAFARHLAECDACREQLEEARRTRGRASAILAASGPPPAEIPPFESVVGARQAAPRRRGISPTALAWAATIVLALGLGWSARTLLTPGSGARQSAEVAETSAAAEAPIALAEPESAAGTSAKRDEEEGVRQSSISRPQQEPAAPSPLTNAAAPVPAKAREEPVEAPTAKGFADVTPAPSAAPPPVPLAAEGRRERARVAVEDFSGIGVSRGSAAELGIRQSGKSRAPAVARGRVTDEAGAPLAGATVVIASANVGVTTTTDGKYELTIPVDRLSDSATLTVRASRLGYRGDTEELALAPGREAEQDFLLPTDVLQLEGLVMTAAEAEAQANEANADAEAPRVLAAALRYLRGRLVAQGRDRPVVVDERILVCDGDSCAAEPQGDERDAEALRRIRRNAGLAERAADTGGATTIALSSPRITGDSAEMSALVEPAEGPAYAVRLTLRQAGLRWRVTEERRLGVD
jgi:hypothetical protein